MEKVYALKKNILKYSLMADLVIMIIAFFIAKEPIPWIYGLAFGGLVGCLNFLHLGRTIENAVKMHPGKAKTYATSQYFLRFITTGIVITISLKADYINVLGTIISLLLVKFVIFATHLFDSKDFYKRIFKRREDV